MSLHPVTLIFLAVYAGIALIAFGVMGWIVWRDRKAAAQSREETNRIVRDLEALLDRDSTDIWKPTHP